MDKNIQTQTVPCNMCKNTDSWTHVISARDRSLHTTRLWKIVKCNVCGLIQLNPRLTKKELANHYQQFNADPNENKILGFFFYKLGYIQKSLTKKLPVSKKCKVLDVGCGRDPFLLIQKDKGHKSYGVDLDPDIITYLQENGIKGRVGELIDTNWGDKYFDVITFWHSLEHNLNPCQTLRECKRILKDDGIVIIEVPNFNCIERKIFGKNFAYIAAPRHLYHFTEESLTKMIKKPGFRIQKIKYPFLSPQLWASSLINFLEDKKLIKLNALGRLITTLILFPLFLPINILCSFTKNSSVMLLHIKKLE